MLVKRHRSKNDIEKQMLTGMIVDTHFLQQISTVFDAKLISMPFVNIVSKWCLSHYHRYGKAPGEYIQDIFKAREKKATDQKTFDHIAEFLDNLSENYSRSKKKDYTPVYDAVLERFKIQEAKLLGEELEDAVDKEDAERAQHLIKAFKSSTANTDLLSKIKISVLPIEELLKRKIKKPPSYIYPWLREGGLTMICADPGVGKTNLAYIIATCLTRRNFDENDIGPWEIKRRAGVLIVDGEMDEWEIKKRLKRFSISSGVKAISAPLEILSTNAFSRDHETSTPPNIEQHEWREAITEYLKNNPKLKVLILDNLFSLTRKTNLLDTNEWADINRWLVSLRHLGISVALLHHTGKSGDQLGAKAREFNLNNVMYLRKPKRKDSLESGFIVNWGKTRDMKPEQAKPFALQIVDDDENGGLYWQEMELLKQRRK